MKDKDYRGLAIVMGGTNYGEADRIMKVLLETGEQISVMAKSIRRSKSKLAGGAQILATNYLEIHFSRSKNSSILVGARMQESFSHILSDFERLETAYAMIKKVKKRGDMINPKFFDILRQSLQGLNDKSISSVLTRTWFLVNFDLLIGEISDLYYGTDGKKLEPDVKYNWDVDEKGFIATHGGGKWNADDIKFLRFLSEKSLKQASNIKNWQPLTQKLLGSEIIRSL
ncbi:DNA repair protein RecO [Candidatus Saccharibacteria bacterium]|nr:DNA repair protein RecO [Candidatus Saccharibacteria bacterium]